MWSGVKSTHPPLTKVQTSSPPLRPGVGVKNSTTLTVQGLDELEHDDEEGLHHRPEVTNNSPKL